MLGIPDSELKGAGGFTAKLEEWSNEIVKRLQKSLDNKSKLATSKALRQSIVAMPVVESSSGVGFDIVSLPYWKFVNSGVQGTGKQTENIKWTNKVTNSPFSFKGDRKPSVKHFIDWAYLAGKSPFAVRETVWRQGLKPNHFYDEVVNKNLITEISEDLAEALGKDITIYLKAE